MRNFWLKSVLLFIIICLLSCGRKTDPELSQAANVIQHWLKPHVLSQSAFSTAFDNPKPSDFVCYIFSDMAASEWPSHKNSPEMYEIGSMKAARIPMSPENVVFVPLAVDPSNTTKKQLVLTFDDDRNLVIVEGYADPHQNPIFKREWNLQKVRPTPLVRQIFRSNVEMGMSYRAY